MITVEMRKYNDFETVEARGRTLESALTNAARKIGATCTTPALVDRQGGGSTYYVQFGRYNRRLNGTVLSDRYIAHVR